MRAAALLLLVAVGLVAADQSPPRTTAPTSPASGPAGAVNAPAASQPAATTTAPDQFTAVIRGRVIRADNGQPIEGARVRTTTGGVAVSDTDGRFELTTLRAGTYSLTAYANGFPPVGFGSRALGDSGRSITVTAGQTVNGIDFALPRGAVLSGVVLDERGDPLPLAPVWVLRPRWVDGERRLVQPDAVPVDVDNRGDITDDRGRFRIFGLRPGTYYLAGTQPVAGATGATAAGLSHDLSAPAMYPTGGPVAEARPLTLAAGQELSGLSFIVRPLRTADITVILSSRNGPLAGDFNYTQVGGSTHTALRTGADGRYSLGQRPPGTYIFSARDGDQVGVARVELQGEDVIVPLTLSLGGTLRGRVVTDEEVPASFLPSDVTVVGRLLQASHDVTATARPDWSFELTGLAGPVSLRTSVRGSWFIRQVVLNGNDVTGLPLDSTRDLRDVQIVLTQKVVRLSGTVRDDTGKVAADAWVVIFAEDPEKRWPGGPSLRAARASADGRFTVSGVPAGPYRAVAVAFLESGEESNPEFVAQLDGASTPVTLSNGITATLDLRLTPWP